MFNAFDVLVLIVVLFAGFVGFQTGVIASVFYVASGFVGLAVAQRYAAAWGMNFYLVFFGSAVLVILLGLAARRLLKKVFLGALDRLGGASLGLLLGLFAVGAVLLPVSGRLPERTRKIVASSFTATRLVPGIGGFLPDMPRAGIEGLREALPSLTPGNKDGK